VQPQVCRIEVCRVAGAKLYSYARSADDSDLLKDGVQDAVLATLTADCPLVTV
jgi:hypothetical protein